jgi:hypothetical protein
MTQQETPAGGGGDPAAAAAAAAAAKGGAGGSALGGGAEKPESWLPEKFLVKDASGKVDEGLSARALAKSYGELQKRLVETGAPPEDADKYELTDMPKGFDVAEFRKDAKTSDFLKGAHSLGMTNKQVNYVINRYLEIAPELAGAAAELSAEEVSAQLRLTWKTDAEFAGNQALAFKAANKLAQSAGVTFEDLEAGGLGNNALFIRLMAALAPQMGEDVPPNIIAGGGGAADWDTAIKAAKAERDALPERDKKGRAAAQAKVDQLYEKKYPTRRAGAFTG